LSELSQSALLAHDGVAWPAAERQEFLEHAADASEVVVDVWSVRILRLVLAGRIAHARGAAASARSGGARSAHQ
jgi:hypothetical protein